MGVGQLSSDDWGGAFGTMTRLSLTILSSRTTGQQNSADCKSTLHKLTCHRMYSLTYLKKRQVAPRRETLNVMLISPLFKDVMEENNVFILGLPEFGKSKLCL